MKTENLVGWLPYLMRWESSPPDIRWRHLGGERLVEPFFDQTIDRCGRDPNNREDRSTLLEALERPAGRSPSCGFHLSHVSLRIDSRCSDVGLRSRAHSHLRGHDRFFDHSTSGSGSLSGPRAESPGAATRRERASPPRTEREGLCFIKFGAGSVRDLDLIRCAFPDVPWIYLLSTPVGGHERAAAHARRFPTSVDGARHARLSA
jgi:hypothetical protein